MAQRSPQKPSSASRRLAVVLFADIEGYTAMMQRDEGLAMAQIERYRQLLERNCTEYHGQLIKSYGDGSLLLFDTAADALYFARHLQLEAQQAPVIPVRIGIHTGEVILNQNDVYGDVVNIASRIESIGVPGAVFLSRDTYDKLQGTLAFPTMELGQFEFKNVAEPVEVLALAAEGLIIPKRSGLTGKLKERIRFEKLPVYPNPFIGRTGQVQTIQTLLQKEEVRLITILGPGGVGKTRFLARIGSLESPRFANGVCFVGLDMIDDHRLVPQYIGAALGLKGQFFSSWEEEIIDFLANKQLLLLLDNMEQVHGAAPFITVLLQSCPELKVIVTSRMLLEQRFEYEFPLIAMAVPAGSEAGSVDELLKYESIQLFIQKARSVRPSFAFDQLNAGVITDICRHLEGLPLAIELAAARIKLFSPQAILNRLERSFDLLKSRSFEISKRHQTIKNTIQWSFELLNEKEKEYFQVMAMFPGGFNPGPLELICPEMDPLDAIEGLLNKSLLRKEGELDLIPRFGMLKMIREFGSELLQENPESEKYWERFAFYFLDFVEEHGSKLKGNSQQSRIARLDAEYENIQKALDWFKNQQADLACRLGAGWWPYFVIRGFLKEGRDMVNDLLRIESNSSATKAGLLVAKGTMAHNLGQYRVSKDAFKAALQIWKELNDKKEIARTLNNLGWAEWRSGNYNHTISYSRDALDIARSIPAPLIESTSLNNLAWVYLSQARYEQAASLLEKVLKINTTYSNERGIAFAKSNLARSRQYLGDTEGAVQLIEEAIQSFQALKDQQLSTFALAIKASFLTNQGSAGEAQRLLEDICLPNFKKIGDIWGMIFCYQGLARSAFSQGHFEEASQNLTQGHTLSTNTEDAWGIAFVHLWQAKIINPDRRPQAALDLLEECINRSDAMQANGLLAEALLDKAKLCLALGKWEECLRCFAAAHYHTELQGHHQLENFLSNTQPLSTSLASIFPTDRIAEALGNHSSIFITKKPNHGN